MKVTFESKGDFEYLTAWLDNVAKSSPKRSLNQIADEGVQNLRANTPKDTGQTSLGWKANIISNKGISEVSWINAARPYLNVNLAVLLDRGYGTGTGGYVPPRPYIQRSMDSVWKTAGDRIAKELTE